MRTFPSRQKGFTLIELLVVIAIIALLSSIVITNLASARLKSRDAALRSQANAMRNLLELNRSDYGDYFNLWTTSGWAPSPTSCGGYGSGTYRPQARDVCDSIVKNSDGDYRFYIGVASGDRTKYSIMTWLPFKQKFLCVGSNGVSSDIDNGSLWKSPGCYNDATLQ